MTYAKAIIAFLDPLIKMAEWDGLAEGAIASLRAAKMMLEDGGGRGKDGVRSGDGRASAWTDAETATRLSDRAEVAVPGVFVLAQPAAIARDICPVCDRTVPLIAIYCAHQDPEGEFCRGSGQRPEAGR